MLGVSPLNYKSSDGMVTREKGVGLCILTADCLPVLLADGTNGVIAALHAGWRGALGGIIEVGLEKMVELGAQTQKIYAAIGPSIGFESYEVGAELFTQFIEKIAWSEALFMPIQNGKYLFDLKGFAAEQLTRKNIAHIDISVTDTMRENTVFFSNRARVKAGETDYGRNASVITLI